MVDLLEVEETASSNADNNGAAAFDEAEVEVVGSCRRFTTSLAIAWNVS